MKVIKCVKCDDDFDCLSNEKRKVGGLINNCPSCSEENIIKYVGLGSADGKQNQTTILKFDSEQDKSNYIKFWRNNSGFNKGKSCQLGTHLSTTPNVKFSTIVSHIPTNHKGKAQ